MFKGFKKQKSTSPLNDPSKILLEVKDISYRSPHGFMIEPLTFHVNTGEMIAIIGPNGSGKSTLLKVLTGQLRPRQGNITLFGNNLYSYPRKKLASILGYLPQQITNDLPQMVYEIVSHGRYPHGAMYRQLTSEDHAIIQWALEKTYLTHYSQRMIQTLSGGERQRAYLAMVLATKPRLLFLDEPNTFLDLVHQIEFLNLLHSLQKEGFTFVIILHDINLAARYANRIIILKEGSMRNIGTPQKTIIPEVIEPNFELKCDYFEYRGRPHIIPLERIPK